jgi:hypothetical protein
VKRLLFIMFTVVFAFGITAAYAVDEGCPGAKASDAGKTCPAKKTGCPMKQAKAETAEDEALSEGESETGHVCPDVSGRATLESFHEAMHPMHVALIEEDFDGFGSCLPNLVKASQALTAYKCYRYDKCPDDCRKNFDGKKAELIEAVDHLSQACKDQDREKITDNFDIMHEAYITFANTCDHREKKAEKEKTE